MISGQNVSNESDAKLSKMKTYEKVFSSMLTPPRGIELDIFPWLLHLGHPLHKEMQVCYASVLFSLQKRERKRK